MILFPWILITYPKENSSNLAVLFQNSLYINKFRLSFSIRIYNKTNSLRILCGVIYEDLVSLFKWHIRYAFS